MYTATGAVYVEQALVSIHSLKRWSPKVKVAVFTDEPDAFDGLADFVEVLAGKSLPSEQRMLPRLECMQNSPFERTLALDTDTVVLGPLDELFALLDSVSVGICHGHQRGRRYSAALRDGKALDQIPYSFAPVQGGVVLFDDADGRAFVDRVVELYKDKQYIDDQVSMRQALWESSHRFAFLGPEYNIWELETLKKWSDGGYEQAFPKIFHTVTLKTSLSPQQIDALLRPFALSASTATERLAATSPLRAPAALGSRSRLAHARSSLRRRISIAHLKRSIQAPLEDPRRGLDNGKHDATIQRRR